MERNKKGQFIRGVSSWNKGKKCSKEWIEKCRKSHLGLISKKRGTKLSKEIRLKISNSLRGKKQSLETIEKRVSHLRGEKNSNWKGGITSESCKIRSSFEIKLWRKSCFERDNFTDAKTGQRGCKLVVHHINNFADFPELRTSIKNGITLSLESHQEFHKIYGKRNNTREQLNEFLNL